MTINLNGMNRGKRNAMIGVVVVAALILSSSLILMNLDSGTAAPDYEKRIKYVPDSSAYVNGETVPSEYIVGYDGIASTEYNPEYWAGTFQNIVTTGDPETLGTPSNWVGPLVTVSVTIKVQNTAATASTVTLTDSAYPHYAAYEITSITGGTKTSSNTCTINASTTASITLNVTVNKVFAGWIDDNGTDDTIILPGDVLDVPAYDSSKPTTLKVLKAKWITPAIFYNKDSAPIVVTDSMSLSDQLPKPYLKLSKSESNVMIIPGDKVYTNKYSSTPISNDSSFNTMFGYIYLLDTGEYCVGKKTLPTGTYRSFYTNNDDDKAELNLAPSSGNTNAGDAYCSLGGAAVIDNIDLKTENYESDITKQPKGYCGKHGVNNTGLFAEGHVLIMGTGIINQQFSPTGWGTEPTDINIGYASTQIFGGKRSSTTTGVVSEVPDAANKKIVFADPKHAELTTRVATYVIIHSGIFYSVHGGSQCRDIGASGNYLSTYVVMKGGIVSDNLVGGSFHQNNVVYGASGSESTNWNTEMVGGTFVYVTGGFMPGDNWTDEQVGDYPSIRGNFQNVEFSALAAGANKGKVYGSTHVFVTDKTSIFDLQGGGRETSSYTGFSYTEISGNATVRHVACGTITNAVTDSQLDLVGSVKIDVLGKAKIASLYGAGYDTYNTPSGQSMTKGTITINLSGGNVNNVFGGGYRGSIGTQSDYSALKILINISGNAKIYDSVYGGGSGGVDKVKHKVNGQWSTANGSNIWKYSAGYSYVYGTITIDMKGGTVCGDVYGGGMSVPVLYKYKGNTYGTFTEGNGTAVAMVYGTTEVKVSGGKVEGGVYGGGKGVTVYASDQLTDAQKENMIGVYKIGSSVVLVGYTEDMTRTQLMKNSGEPTSTDWYLHSNSTTNKIIQYRYPYAGDVNYYDHFAEIEGNTKVIISGNAQIMDSVYGGGALGKVENVTGNSNLNGNTLVEVKGGLIEGDVFGGGLGSKGITSIEGDRSVFISMPDKEVEEVAIKSSTTEKVTNNMIKGDVYGGSAYGNDGLSKGILGSDATIVIERGNIGNDVFGGGVLGNTYGNTKIYVGYTYDAKYNYGPDTSTAGGVKTLSVKSIFAGANIDTDNPTSLFEETLVWGYGSIDIFGNNGTARNFSITGSIMGSGFSVNTGIDPETGDVKATTVNIDSFINKSPMEGLHRISNLTITQCSLNLQGRGSMTPVDTGTEQPFSIFMIDNLTLKWDTTLIINASIDYIGNYRSLTSAGGASTVMNPSNRIVYMDGYTFNVRTVTNGSSVYNDVEGYTLMLTQQQTGYGAYAISKISPKGGFSAVREGTTREAEYYDLTQDTRYWYLSGTAKKVMSMKMEYGEETTGNPLNVIESSVSLTKLQANSEIRYVGGTFTSSSTDSNQNEYSFVKPGTNKDGSTINVNEFGFIIGYGDESSSSNTVYAETQHYLDLGSETYGEYSGNDKRWVNCSYYAGSKSSDIEPAKGTEDEENPTYVTKSLYPVRLLTSKATGELNLNFMLVGNPENYTSYLGYLTLTVQEVTDVVYTVTEKDGSIKTQRDTMVLNTTDIRIELYVIGNSKSAAADYSTPMKMDLDESGTTYSGTTQIILATGYTLCTVKLQSIYYLDGDGNPIKYMKDGHEVYLDDDSSVQFKITGIMNGDKTTGWRSVNGSIPIYVGNQPSLNEDKTIDRTKILDQEVGVLLGSVVATEEYTVTGLPKEVIEQIENPMIELTIDVVKENGEYVRSTVSIMLQERPPCTITYYVEGVPSTKTVTQGDYITANFLEFSETNFIGWYLDEDYNNPYNYGIPVTTDITLYARFAYEVTFDYQTGNSSKTYIPKDKSGTLIQSTSTPNPTRVGYELVGWSKDREGADLWDFENETIEGDVILYAVWEGYEVLVQFKYVDPQGVIHIFQGDPDGSNYIQADDGKYYYMTTEPTEPGKEKTYKFPTVRVGSLFSTTDPRGADIDNEYILDYAAAHIIDVDESSKDRLNYTHWTLNKELSSGQKTSYYVTINTVLTADMINWNAAMTPGWQEGSSVPKWTLTLEATTSYVSIVVDMDVGIDKTKDLYDLSAYVVEPKTIMVYPDMPVDMSSTQKTDSDGKKYYESIDGKYHYYDDGNGSFYVKESGTYLESLGDDLYEDKYGRVFFIDPDTGLSTLKMAYEYIPELPYVKKDDGKYYLCDDSKDPVEVSDDPAVPQPYGATYPANEYGIIVKINGIPLVYIESVYKHVFEETYDVYYYYNEQSETWTELQNPPSLETFYKDKYDNRYDKETLACIYGSETYYSFSFTLNDAVRSGYKLTSWHNSHVLSDPLYPSSGMSRTIKLMFHEYGGYILVDKEILETVDSSGHYVVYENIDYEYVEVFSEEYTGDNMGYGSFDGYLSVTDPNDGKTYPAINYKNSSDSGKRYKLTYYAKWAANEYTVSVSNDTSAGTVSVYKINSDGSTTPLDTSEILDGVKYGDRLLLSYAPSGASQFDKWIITGEYEISDASSTNATLVVHGNCTISARDVNEKTTDIMIYFDNGRLSENDYNHVGVYLYNTKTQQYIKMTGLAGKRDMELYRGSVPLCTDADENYVVCVRWYDDTSKMNDVDYNGYEQYQLTEYTPLRITMDSPSEHIYYIISARIIVSATLNNYDNTLMYSQVPNGLTLKKNDTGEVVGSLTTGEQYISILDGGEDVVTISRYVGVNKEYLDNIGTIINDPTKGAPPVLLTIKSGYTYSLFEGFPDVKDGVEYYNIDVEHNYYSGYAYENLTLRFDLNWTKIEKPADIIIKLNKTDPENPKQYNIQLMDQEETSIGTEFVVAENSGFYGTGKITSTLTPGSQYIKGNNTYTIVDWYYDKQLTIPVKTTDVLNSQTSVYLEKERINRNVGLNIGGGVQLDQNTAFLYEGNWNHFTLYAKITVSTVKEMVVYINKENVGEGYTTDTSLKIYLELQDQTYVGSYKTDAYSGYDLSKTTAKLNGDVSGYITAVKTDNKVSSFEFSIPSSYFSDKGNRIDVYYQLKTVELKINPKLYETWDDMESFADAVDYTVTKKCGETVILPSGFNYGTFSRWEATNNNNSIVEDGNDYKYTVHSDDIGTITFEAQYSSTNLIKVTFNTNVGVFETNNYPTYTMDVPNGTELDIEDYTIIGYDTNGHQFDGFGNWKTGTTTVSSENKTFNASWIEKTVKFRYSVQSENDEVSIVNNANKTNLEPDKTYGEDQGYAGITYNSAIVIVVKPEMGKHLDVNGTRGTHTIMGSPTLLSDGRTYSWSFLLTEEMTDLEIKTVGETVNINFFVDGKLVTYTTSDQFVVTDSSDNTKTYNWGRNIEKYSTVSFSDYGGNPWYTDQSYKTLYQNKETGYTYYANKDINLYTTLETFPLFLHDNPSLIGDSRDTSQRYMRAIQTEENTAYQYITIPDVKKNVEGAIFIGWGVVDTNDKSTLTYLPVDGEKIYLNTLGGAKQLHLYAYYLQLSDSMTFIYKGDGKKYYQDITNYTAIKQNSIPDGIDITIRYSDEVELNSTNYDLVIEETGQYDDHHVYPKTTENIFTVKDAGDSKLIYYYGVVKKGGLEYSIKGSYTISVSKANIYIFAPSVSKVDDGRTLTCTANDIKILIDGVKDATLSDLEAAGYTCVLKDGNGYSITLAETGKVRTGVTCTISDASKAIHYNMPVVYDGVLIIYDSDSARYMYGGF